MPVSRNKRKRSEIDQGKVPSATARRGSSKSSSGHELKRAKNEAPKRETEPSVTVMDVSELPFKTTISQAKAEPSDSTQRQDFLVGTVESSENIPPPAQPQSHTARQDQSPTNPTPGKEDSETYEGVTNDPASAEQSRGSRIDSIISHRKLLLKRIRQCEFAANGRLASLIELEKKQKEMDSRASSSADGVVTQNSALATDEVEYFRELSKNASLAAKRQKSDAGEGAGESRPSVSLRRGASVGKRMNAALSTLAPGGNTLVASVDPSPATIDATIGNAKVLLASTSNVSKAIAPQNAPATAQLQILANRPVQQQLPPPPQQQQQQPPLQHLQPVLQPPSGTVGKMASQPKEKSKRSGSHKQTKSAQSTTLSDQYAPAALPLHPRMAGSTLPPNRLAHPKVICPETRALREKRGALRLKLAALLAAKSKPIKESGQNRHTSQQKQFQPFSSQKHSQEDDQFDWEASERDFGAPLVLPKRRKSHWDYVMEEMRWLATDFVEERKWKQSTARLLASVVVSGTGSTATSNTTSSIAANTTGNPFVPQPTLKESSIAVIVETPKQIRARDQVGSEQHSEAEGKQPSNSSCSPIECDSQLSRIRRYERLTPGESKELQRIARQTSSIPHLLSAALGESGTLPSSGSLFAKSLQNWPQTRRKVAVEGRSRDFSDTAKNFKPQENGINKESTSHVATTGPKVPSEGKDVSTEPGIDAGVSSVSSERPIANARVQVAQYIDDLCLRVKSFHSAPQKRSKQTRLHESLMFSPEQEDAIRFAEYIWSEIDSASVVLEGPAFSGKTAVSCFLLWKHRNNGPQLLLCSPASVLRWEFELSRFAGLTVTNLGFSEGMSFLPVVNFEPIFKQSDVVLCEYSFLNDAQMPDLSVFDCIAIDCRRPLGFEGSIGSANLQRENDNVCPSELLSVAWWETVLDKLPSQGVRRLLIDGPTKAFSLFRNFMDLEVLALRTSFVLGPKACIAMGSSHARIIISWAKHEARASPPEIGESKAERVTTVLLRAFSSFSYSFKYSPMNETKASSIWQQRQCAIPNSQRLAYNLTCKEVRGILSKGIESKKTSYDGGDHLADIVNSLLRLRRVCCHDNIEMILSGTIINGSLSYRPPKRNEGSGSEEQFTSSLFFRGIRESASQPNLERASRILSGSGKIRELASILRNDCGCQLAGEEVLLSLIPERETRKGSTPRKSKSSQLTKRRVVILAELPDVQLLVSLFLNAVGLQHELLLRVGLEPNPSIEDTERVTLAWIEHQLCLLKFNSSETRGNSATSCKIVVGSPCSLGADHCGLGVETADLIISLDEDWSGRCQLVMRSIVAQSLVWTKTQASSTSCTFIRLVANDTCEAIFLSALRRLERESRHFMLTTDKFGIVTDIRFSGALDGDEVAHRLWNFRGQELSDILCSQEDLPAVFGSQSRRQFLPNLDCNGESESERRLIRRLLQRARGISGSTLSMPSNEYDFCTNRCENDDAFFLVLPPAPSHFPQHVATKRDRGLLASRLYLERCAKFTSCKQGGAVTQSDPLNPNNMSDWESFGVDAMDGSELTDSWRKSGLSYRPTESAASLLMYASTMNVTEIRLKAQNLTPSKAKVSSTDQRRSEKFNSLITTPRDPYHHGPPRINAFAGSYSVASIDHTMRDGNQGCEATVYFPPIFPSFVSFSAQADVEAQRWLRTSLEETMSTDVASAERDDLKRKQPEPSSFVATQNSKRFKAQNAVSDTWDIDLLPLAEHLVDQVFPPSPRAFHRDQTPHKAVTPAATIAEQLNFPGRFSSDNGTLEVTDFEYLRDVNEDYGLAGIGLLPPVLQSINAAGIALVECSASAQDTENLAGDFEMNLYNIPCDAEEAENAGRTTGNCTLLNSIILFVVKQKPQISAGTVGQPFRMGQNLIGESPWTAMPNNLPSLSYIGGNNGAVVDVNGGAKKTKKKSPGPLPPLGPSAFSRLPVPDISEKIRPMAMQVVSTTNKDGYRNRMLLSPQITQLLGKLFDMPSFRMASLRIRNRISDRIARLDRSSSERSLGLPTLESSNQHFSTKGDANAGVSLVRKLRNPKSQTGDEAKAFSVQQKAALKRSLVSPCRVDFGPFQSGFLAAPGGMTGISPPRSRVGVSLPMGVKVPQALREHNVPPWSDADNRKLQACAVRFGLNWVLASRSLTGLEDILVSSRRTFSPDDDNLDSFPRSARHCRDRWQTLVKFHPSLAKDVLKSERVMRERAVMAASEIPQNHGSALRLQARDDEGQGAMVQDVAILVSASKLTPTEGDPLDMIVEMEESESLNDAKSQQPGDVPSRPRRTFAACRAGRLKTVVIPLAMPGLTGGSSSALVASHQSHMQAVQAALATSNPSSGRTELWPLQILELADKQRAATARALAETTALSSSSAAAAGRPTSTHSHRSATTSTSHSNNAANGRGVAFPQVPLPPPQQRSTSLKSTTIAQPERLTNPTVGSPSRSPRKTVAIPLPAQALPPPPPPALPPPLPPQPQASLPPQPQSALPMPPQQHPPRPPPSNPQTDEEPTTTTASEEEPLSNP